MPAPALQAAGAALGGRSLLPRALAAAARRAARPAAARSSRRSRCCRPAADRARSSVPDGIPAAFVPVYRESARAFGLNWLLLASVHQQETGFSTNPTTYHGLNAAGCCAGPFQFNVTNGPPSTWDSHKHAYRRGAAPGRLPAPAGAAPVGLRRLRRRHGRRRRCCAATAPTRRSAPRTFQAVRAYNGAGPVAEAYARRVIDRARLWQTNAPPTPATPARPRSRRLGRGELTWPVRGPVTSPFCERRAWEACHPGIDIAVPTGTPILAAATGRVTTRGAGLAATATTPACSTRPPPADLLRAPVAPRTHPQRRHRRRAARSSATSAAPAAASARTCTSRSASTTSPSTRSPTSPSDGLRCRVRLTRARARWSASWPAARTPTSKTARTTAAAQPARRRPATDARRGQRPPRAPARDTAPTIAANARATARSAVNAFCAAVDQLELAHDRTPAATARRASRPGHSPASSRQKPQARAQDQALRRDRLGARGHVVAIDVKRGQRHAPSGLRGMASNRSPTDAPTSADARHRVYLATVTRTRDGWAVSQWQPQP